MSLTRLGVLLKSQVPDYAPRFLISPTLLTHTKQRHNISKKTTSTLPKIDNFLRREALIKIATVLCFVIKFHPLKSRLRPTTLQTRPFKPIEDALLEAF